jgi:hypothetical protein
MLYSIDTSAILDGWVRYYPPVTFKKLWLNLEKLIESGKLRATEEVIRELGKKGDDDVSTWCKARDGFFIDIDDAIQTKVTEILAAHPNLVDEGKGRSGADPFVIALAELHNCKVITGEALTNKLSRPRIPDICHARTIQWGNLLSLVQSEKWTF